MREWLQHTQQAKPIRGKRSAAEILRELREELQIDAQVGTELARYEHDYPSGSRVHLLFFTVPVFTGEPTGRVFEQIRWTDLHALPTLDFLDGDLDFVKRLARGDFEQELR